MSDYASRVLAWINATFPHPGHRLAKAGVGGAISSYFALCTELHAPLDTDLVFLEASQTASQQPELGDMLGLPHATDRPTYLDTAAGLVD